MRTIYKVSQRTRKSWTGWRMTQSDANRSLSTCQLVDAHTAVDRAVVDGAIDGAAVDDRPRQSRLLKQRSKYSAPASIMSTWGANDSPAIFAASADHDRLSVASQQTALVIYPRLFLSLEQATVAIIQGIWGCIFRSLKTMTRRDPRRPAIRSTDKSKCGTRFQHETSKILTRSSRNADRGQSGTHSKIASESRVQALS